MDRGEARLWAGTRKRDTGTVYIWPRKTGYSFPIDEEVVAE